MDIVDTRREKKLRLSATNMYRAVFQKKPLKSNNVFSLNSYVEKINKSYMQGEMPVLRNHCQYFATRK